MLPRLLWLLLLGLPSLVGAQTATVGAPARVELLNLFQAESKRGASIFYTQAYTSHRHHLEFKGSIFGVIQDVQADGCDLKIKSEISDLYSGNVETKLVSQIKNHYITAISFKLTRKIADNLKIVDGYPVRQLAHGTHAVCSEGRPCTLTWLRLNAESKAIKMTDITNDIAGYDGDVVDFDGLVEQVDLPVSSREAGDELIAKLRLYAELCAQ